MAMYYYIYKQCKLRLATMNCLIVFELLSKMVDTSIRA